MKSKKNYNNTPREWKIFILELVLLCMVHSNGFNLIFKFSYKINVCTNLRNLGSIF